MDINQAAFAISLYFIARTVGCFSGSMILAKWSTKKFFFVSVVSMLVATAGFFLFDSKTGLYVCIALAGFGNSNIYSMLFSQALLSIPTKQNEISGLLVMGLFGGTIFPMLMGVAADALRSQNGSLLVLAAGMIYLLFLSFKLKQE